MSAWGTAVLTRRDDGRVSVESADDVIAISVDLLASEDAELFVGQDGLLWLAGDSNYRYRPVRFAPRIDIDGTDFPAVKGVMALVCERVR